MHADTIAAVLASAAALVTAIAHALDLRAQARERELRQLGHRRTRHSDR